ncbi:MAG TPA: hypothetical protein VKJ47_22020 [Candidatus Binatia bacterium]|nr:hypothetical protein [Candidatus Binatia bacterium]
MADEETWEDLAKRRTALVVKIDERDTRMVERLDALQTMIEEQRTFNKEQLSINTRLETLMTRVFQERHNGHED